MRIKLLFITLLVIISQIKCDDIYNVAIIGGGAAGLAAAKYLARAKLKPLVIEEDELGGQLNKANIISNWPAVPAMQGREIAELMVKQAKELGTRFIISQVRNLSKKGNLFDLELKDGKHILARSVILASGARPSKLAIPGEQEYLGKGVAICAICDAPLYRNKSVVVIGGDYSALREIEIISKYTNKITIINKNPELEGPLMLLNPINENKNIKVMNNCTAQEILGDGNSVTGVKILNTKINKNEIISAEGIFISVGWKPSSQLVENKIELDRKKRVKIYNNTQTSMSGLFAVGDVANNGDYHQAPVSANFGYIAGMDAETYLRQNKSIV